VRSCVHRRHGRVTPTPSPPPRFRTKRLAESNQMLGFKNAKQTEARERSYYRKDRAIWKQSKSVEAAGLGNAKGDGLPWPCGERERERGGDLPWTRSTGFRSLAAVYRRICGCGWRAGSPRVHYEARHKQFFFICLTWNQKFGAFDLLRATDFELKQVKQTESW
jgi:hypothetical protein